MEFDLRRELDLPSHLEDDLKGIREGSLSAVQQYVRYWGFNLELVTKAYFGEGSGTIETKCRVAAEIADFLGCPVQFQHNGTPATAYPDAAYAAYCEWCERQRQVKP